VKTSEEQELLDLARELFAKGEYEPALKELEKVDTYCLQEKFQLYNQIVGA
jgi:chemosensory pili system protein ChpA (sensor histidine kinase/response regulator)